MLPALSVIVKNSAPSRGFMDSFGKARKGEISPVYTALVRASESVFLIHSSKPAVA